MSTHGPTMVDRNDLGEGPGLPACFSFRLPNRKRYPYRRAPFHARQNGDRSAMGFGDLAHQRQAEAISLQMLLPRGAVERLEHLFPVRFGHAIATIADRQGHRLRRVLNLGLDRWGGMIVRVLQEISDKPAQQAWIAGNLRRPTGQRAVLIAGAFFRHQRDQIDFWDRSA